MGQNIVNCVTRRWGGRLSTVSLLSYLLSTHLLPRRFPPFLSSFVSLRVHLSQFLPPSSSSSALTQETFLLLTSILFFLLCSFTSLFSQPLSLHITPFITPLLLLRFPSPALWLATQTVKTLAKFLAAFTSVFLFSD